MIEAQIESDRRAATSKTVIDAAVHNEVPSARALFPYLPAYWVEHLEQTQFKGPSDSYYPTNSPVAALSNSRPSPEEVPPPLTARTRAAPAAGPAPASAVGVVQREVLTGDVEAAVLCSAYPVDS